MGVEAIADQPAPYDFGVSSRLSREAVVGLKRIHATAADELEVLLSRSFGEDIRVSNVHVTQVRYEQFVAAAPLGSYHFLMGSESLGGQFQAAIDAASKGFSSLTLSVAREAARDIQSEGGYNPAEFTERENAIAQLVADGHSDTAIAEELNIASSTIRNHLTSIYRKLDVESRTQLASRVWRQRASSPGHTPSNEG